MSSMRVLALVLVVTLASPSWGRMEDWKTIELGKSCACWSKAKSEQAARVDKSKLQQYRASFAAASNKYNLPKEILMAVASRESRVGSLLGKNGNKPGWGDKNRAFGIMQVKKKHPNWSYGWHLRGAVAAYNFGSKNVQTKSGIDKGSAKTCKPCGGNYSWDTLQRARWLAAKEKTMQMQ